MVRCDGLRMEAVLAARTGRAAVWLSGTAQTGGSGRRRGHALVALAWLAGRRSGAGGWDERANARLGAWRRSCAVEWGL